MYYGMIDAAAFINVGVLLPWMCCFCFARFGWCQVSVQDCLLWVTLGGGVTAIDTMSDNSISILTIMRHKMSGCEHFVNMTFFLFVRAELVPKHSNQMSLTAA